MKAIYVLLALISTIVQAQTGLKDIAAILGMSTCVFIVMIFGGVLLVGMRDRQWGVCVGAAMCCTFACAVIYTIFRYILISTN